MERALHLLTTSLLSVKAVKPVVGYDTRSNVVRQSAKARLHLCDSSLAKAIDTNCKPRIGLTRHFWSRSGRSIQPIPTSVQRKT